MKGPFITEFVMNGPFITRAAGTMVSMKVIGLLVGPEDSPVPTFPTTRLHAEAAVDYALGRATLPSAPARSAT
jgi:aspartate racemase